MVELEIHFHGYETQIKLFQIKKTLFKLVFLHIYNNITTTAEVQVLVPAVFDDSDN